MVWRAVPPLVTRYRLDPGKQRPRESGRQARVWDTKLVQLPRGTIAGGGVEGRGAQGHVGLL